MKNVRINAKLPLTIFKEGDLYVADCPVLEIATAGKTVDEAKIRFNELVQIFFEELIDMGTLDQVLLSCGWQKAII